MIAQVIRRGVGVRRGIVVAFALAAAGLLAVSLTRDDANSTWEWWVLFVLLGAAWFAARYASGDIAEGRSDRLDEREREIRYRALRTGYHAVWLTGLAVAVFLQVVDDVPGLVARGGSVLFAAILASAAVPSLLLCWAPPEPDPEDD